MTRDDEHARTGHGAEVRRDRAQTQEPAAPDAPWLLRHKVELPDPIKGYVRRPDVEGRCALMAHRLTVLHAPGGFGKTALLARCCRTLRSQGVAVAWLSLDEDDGPESVATYLTLAFERAGLEVVRPRPASVAGTPLPRRRTWRRTVRPSTG